MRLTISPAAIEQMLACTVVGSPATIQTGLQDLINRTGVNEFMMTGQIFDHQARLRSFEIAAQVAQNLYAAELVLS